MTRLCCCLLLAVAVEVAAGEIRIVFDGNALTRLPAPGAFMLPDGSEQRIDDLIRACSNPQRTAGLLQYRPADASCRSLRLVGNPERPPVLPVAGEITVFHVPTQQQCRPGRCRTLVAGASALAAPPPEPPPAVVIHVFGAEPDSLEAPGEVMLSWNTSHASSCRIEDDKGSEPQSVALSGSTGRTVEQTTEFTLVCGNQAGQAEARVTVTVESVDGPQPFDPVFVDRFQVL